MNSAENVSLLPCPFCGSTDIATDGPSFTQFMCNGCGSTTYDQDGHAEAIAAWNRRATSDVTEALRNLVEDISDRFDMDSPSTNPGLKAAVADARTALTELQALRSPPTEDADRVEPVAWGSGTIDRLQRAILDDDEAVRERAAENVAVLYAHSVAPYAAALAMVREAIGELFGPKASIESEDATLLRGPEPHHEAEAQIAALRRVSASPRPETVGVSDAMVERAARAMWKASVPPGQEDAFPDHACIARNLYIRSAYAALTAALSPQEGE